MGSRPLGGGERKMKLFLATIFSLSMIWILAFLLNFVVADWADLPTIISVGVLTVVGAVAILD